MSSFGSLVWFHYGGHMIRANVHGHTRASSYSHINLFTLTGKLSIQKHLPVMAMLLHTVSHIGVHPHTAQPRFFFYGKPSSVLPVTVTEALDPGGESGLHSLCLGALPSSPATGVLLPSLEA